MLLTTSLADAEALQPSTSNLGPNIGAASTSSTPLKLRADFRFFFDFFFALFAPLISPLKAIFCNDSPTKFEFATMAVGLSLP
jgi:hypothetical protein